MLARWAAVSSFVISLMQELSRAFVCDLPAWAENFVMSWSDDAGTSFLSRHIELKSRAASIVKLMCDLVTTNKNIMQSLIELLLLTEY